MKMDSAILVTKASCYMVIGFFTPLTVSLAQWANSGENPPKIIWVIVGASCVVGGCSQLLSFLSGSYSDYVKGRANGSGSPGDSTALLASKAAAKAAVYASLPSADKPANVEPPKA